MRIFENTQMSLGVVAIEDIQINLRSRDEVPQILLGLQYIYAENELREQVINILRKLVPKNVNADFGRPGMHLWKILVLGCIRLGCNIDFDRLHDLANHHGKIREFLFHPDDDKTEYSLNSIRENVQLFTPEVLNEINELVVKAGHGLVKKKVLNKMMRFPSKPVAIHS